MLLAMAEDIRVVLIKLADRLHNMRTLYAPAVEKQQRIARQTMEIYAPLAERLGIWQIKWELEDLAFKALEPETYRELAKLLDTRRKGRESYIERAIAELRPKLEAAGIEADIEGRPKHIYSIWKKMQRKGAEFGEIYDVYAIRVLVDEVRDCYAALGIVHSHVAADPGPVRRLHRRPQEQPLPVAPHGGDRARRQAARDPDPDPRDAPGLARSASPPTGATRRAPSPTASTTPSSPGCASSWTGSATSADATEFVEGIKLDIFQDQVFVFTPEGRHQGPAGRRDAARLRLPHPHRRRPPHDRRQGQQPARAARLPAQERRHRRDRDDQGRARPVARLAERRPDQPRPREDPPMVQAQGPRREHRPRPRVARARAAPARPGRRSRRSALDRIAEVAQAVQLRDRSTTSTPRSATARSAPSRSSCAWASSTTGRAALPDGRAAAAARSGPAASGSRASATSWSGSPSAATRSRATRSSGFITRGKGVTVHLQILPDRRQRARGQPPHRRRMGGRADPDLPDRDPGRGVRPDRPALATSPRSWPRTRSTSWRPTVAVTPDHTAVVTATLQVALGRAAGPRHEPHRDAQGRHQRPARPRLGPPFRQVRARRHAAGERPSKRVR